MAGAVQPGPDVHSSGRPPPDPLMPTILLTAGIATAVIAAAWVFIGPTGFIFAWVTHFILMAWAAAAVGPRMRVPDHEWLRVRPWEPRLYRSVGAKAFGRLLDAAGWNRLITRERGFDGTRKGLDGLDQHTRRSEIGHLVCWCATVVLAVGALWAGSWVGAVWLLGLGVPFHLYPVLLQRVLRARIQALPSRG